MPSYISQNIREMIATVARSTTVFRKYLDSDNTAKTKSEIFGISMSDLSTCENLIQWVLVTENRVQNALAIVYVSANIPFDMGR